MVQIKVCGLTRKQDVMTAVKFGVDALGFILAKSPRQIDLGKVYKLTDELPPFISTVGVVVNPSIKRLEKIAGSNLFDYIQFHGNEEPDLIAKNSVKSIKAISISDQRDLIWLKRYQEVDYFLFDTKIDSKKGGTGISFDWSLINNCKINSSFILAGGLGPDNILQALAEVESAAVDLNSKVEISPGIKDKELLKQTISKIKGYK